ncbi:MAG TPA: glycosyltransferase family 2 protein [Bacteroidaceae bacterium]|nr:glycosyltransferase family 2 protein [Bacteroidaceae bacterium]
MVSIIQRINLSQYSTGTDKTRELIKSCQSRFALINISGENIEIKDSEIERFVDTAITRGAGMVYSDYFKYSGNNKTECPTIEYQPGSIRDNFNFGALVLVSREAMDYYLSHSDSQKYKHTGFYQFRLILSENFQIIRLQEYLYTIKETDNRKSGEKQFDYVNPKNSKIQLEMEQICTDHLKRIGAYLEPGIWKEPDLNSTHNFPCELSVIIPVRNRVTTIEDALSSALSQKTDFNYNILVVDNHSTDGTSSVIDHVATDKRVVKIVPQTKDLGIGGCWNLALNNKLCGKFAVQLDSDDLYSDNNTLQKIVDTFYYLNCAMLIGSYRICDFKLNTLPPGLIDHKEWSSQNGRNNALRINGLGAPRAFYTPIIRKIGFPNVSYGEDYAVGLAMSREWKIGRIYEELYLCRRWEGNSDFSLNIDQINANDFYKDTLRSEEIVCRIKKNKGKNPY